MHSTGVHDSLLAKAMLLDDAESRLAIAGVDARSLERSTVRRV